MKNNILLFTATCTLISFSTSYSFTPLTEIPTFEFESSSTVDVTDVEGKTFIVSGNSEREKKDYTRKIRSLIKEATGSVVYIISAEELNKKYEHQALKTNLCKQIEDLVSNSIPVTLVIDEADPEDESFRLLFAESYRLQQKNLPVYLVASVKNIEFVRKYYHLPS